MSEPFPIETLPFCGCGCGERVSKPTNKFLNGHITRVLMKFPKKSIPGVPPGVTGQGTVGVLTVRIDPPTTVSIDPIIDTLPPADGVTTPSEITDPIIDPIAAPPTDRIDDAYARHLAATRRQAVADNDWNTQS